MTNSNNNSSKNANKKIIIPIVVIPIAFIVFIVGIIAFTLFGFNTGISESKILGYLQGKYPGNFSNITIFDSQKSSYAGSCDGSDFNHGYDDQSYYYYNVYSDYYDTNFVVTCKKQLFSVSCFGVNFSSEEIYDNLTKAQNDKRLINIVNTEMAQYKPSISSNYIPFGKSCDFNVDIKFNSNFNMQYYNILLNFQNKLNTETRDNKGSQFKINIIFNDISFDYSINSIWTTVNGHKSIRIDDKDFWNYVGK